MFIYAGKQSACAFGKSDDAGVVFVWGGGACGAACAMRVCKAALGGKHGARRQGNPCAVPGVRRNACGVRLRGHASVRYRAAACISGLSTHQHVGSPGHARVCACGNRRWRTRPHTRRAFAPVPRTTGSATPAAEYINVSTSAPNLGFVPFPPSLLLRRINPSETFTFGSPLLKLHSNFQQCLVAKVARPVPLRRPLLPVLPRPA